MQAVELNRDFAEVEHDLHVRAAREQCVAIRGNRFSEIAILLLLNREARDP